MNIELAPWRVPNYILGVMPPRPRQEGFIESPKWKISELDPITLAVQCDKFRVEVFKKAGKADPQQEGK